MLWPVHRPRSGLSIGLRQACLVEVRPAWPRTLFRRSGGNRSIHGRACALPAGLVHPSDTRPNLTDVQALAGRLRELRGRRQGMLPIALSLPDPAARVALLDFEALPQKTADLEPLLRWRLQQECNLPAVPMRLAYRVFRLEEAAAGERPLRVWVAAVREEIYTQYVEACAEAGFYPVATGLASLQIFDLYRPVLEKAPRDFVFLHHAEWGFAFFAFRGSSLQFIRVKTWPSLMESPEEGEPPHEPGREAGLLSDEVLATLQFYTEAVPADPASGPRPLFLVDSADDGAAPAQDGRTQAQIEALGLTLVPLAGTGEADDAAAGAADPHTVRSPGGLAALAGVWEA